MVHLTSVLSLFAVNSHNDYITITVHIIYNWKNETVYFLELLRSVTAPHPLIS